MALAAVGIVRPSLRAGAIAALAPGAFAQAFTGRGLRAAPVGPGRRLSVVAPLRPRAAWRRLLSNHRAFFVLLGIGVLIRLLALISYRPAMYFYGDSYSYLRIASELRPDPARPPVYPLFLRLFSFGGGAETVVLQHLLGLAVAVGVYLLLRRLGAGPLAGALGAAPMLLDGYQVHIEHVVLAETLFQALVFGALMLVMWRERASVRAVAFAGALLGLAVLTRTAGLPLVFPVIGYMLVRRFGMKRVVAFMFAFAVPLLGHAAWFGAHHGKFVIQDYDGYFLYGRVGEFADCSQFETSRRERLLCDARPASERPGANFYVWNRTSPLRKYRAEERGNANAEIRRFARRAILAQPADYARTVTGDFLHYFAPGRRTGDRDHSVNTWRFQRSTEEVRAAMNGQSRYKRTRLTSVHAGLAGFLRGYQGVVYTYGPAVLIAMLLGFAGWRGLPRARRTLGPESATFAACALLTLLVPVATAIFDYRYLLPALPLLGPSAVLGWRVLAARRTT